MTTTLDNSTATERIAKIERTFLGYEDHGIFTAIINLSYGSSAQGAGMLSLDYRDKENEGGRIETDPGCVHRFVTGCLRACGVDQWEHIKGRTVIAICEEGWNGKVVGLKPLPTEPGSEFLFSDTWSPGRWDDIGG